MQYQVVDREKGERVQEPVYGGFGFTILSYFPWIETVLTHHATASRFYGWWQSLGFSRWKISPFCRRFTLDTHEFLEETFPSFQAFFTRRLKPHARPIASTSFVMPADARYTFYPHISQAPTFSVKGTEHTLKTLLEDASYAKSFAQGSLCIARLCPFDYHRFHFPIEGKIVAQKCIPGRYYSVSPWKTRRAPLVYCENLRHVTVLETAQGLVAMVEVGATFVGSIQQFKHVGDMVQKGEEKGVFAFGGSCVIVLFANPVSFAKDLLTWRQTHGLEIFCKMGSPLSDS